MSVTKAFFGWSLTAVLILAGVAPPARAINVMFTAVDPIGPQPHAALAEFSLTGNVLSLTLTNTASPATTKYGNSDLLDAVFFGSTALALTPVSATATALVDSTGSTVCSQNCNVGTGWGFANLTSPVYGSANAVSAAGYGVFDRSNFGGTATKLDGGDYGIVPADFPGNAGAQVNKKFSPLARNSVVFEFLVPGNFQLSSIDTVAFQYGANLTDLHLVGALVPSDPPSGGGEQVVSPVPEPASMLLMAGGLGALALLRRYGRRALPR